jgi:general secretion pathway protein J
LRSKGARGSNQKGFTLLEVLVSLVLLGLLLAALGQGLRFGLSAWELQKKAVDRTESLEATDRALRLLIEGMDPGVIGGVQPPVVGRQDRMSFVAPLPAAVAIDRRAEMTLIVADQGRLVLRWRAHRHEKPFGALPRETDALLLEGVERLELAYWKPRGRNFDGGWVDEWAQPGLPGLVRIRLHFGEKDPRHWPDIVVAPVRELRAY